MDDGVNNNAESQEEIGKEGFLGEGVSDGEVVGGVDL